jgi:hypothetical protein
VHINALDKMAAADVARMMADLGLARRDLVSAPEADAKGRRLRDDPYQQRMMRAKEEERRARLGNEETGESRQTALLKRWNSEAPRTRE